MLVCSSTDVYWRSPGIYVGTDVVTFLVILSPIKRGDIWLSQRITIHRKSESKHKETQNITVEQHGAREFNVHPRPRALQREAGLEGNIL